MIALKDVENFLRLTSGLPVAKQGHGAETRTKDPRVSGRNIAFSIKLGPPPALLRAVWTLPNQLGNGNHLTMCQGCPEFSAKDPVQEGGRDS